MQRVVIESALDRNFSFFSTPGTNPVIEVTSFGALHSTDEEINVDCNEFPYL